MTPLLIQYFFLTKKTFFCRKKIMFIQSIISNVLSVLIAETLILLYMHACNMHILSLAVNWSSKVVSHLLQNPNIWNLLWEYKKQCNNHYTKVFHNIYTYTYFYSIYMLQFASGCRMFYKINIKQRLMSKNAIELFFKSPVLQYMSVACWLTYWCMCA